MYSIIELQTNDNNTVHIYYSAETIEQAMSKFHEVLAYAAISKVEIHACVILAENGNPVAKEYFEHSKTENQ